MGKQNRARRAAKAKKRAHAQRERASTHDGQHPGRGTGQDHGRSQGQGQGQGQGRGQGEGQGRGRGEGRGAGDRSGGTGQPSSASENPYDDPVTLQRLLVASSDALRRKDPNLELVIDHLAEARTTELLQAAETLLLTTVSAAWEHGWQPSELHRQARRATNTAPAARAVHLAMAADDVGRRGATLDGRWIAQVAELDLPATDGRPGWLRAWHADASLDASNTARALVDAIACTARLPPLAVLLPRPGHPEDAARLAVGPDGVGVAESDAVLEKIRALLAKAESTTFAAEAEAFTAKAQELMTRHAIDAAVLSAREPARDRPIQIRVPIDSPYADAKGLLLQVVAGSSRCRAVGHGDLGLTALIGYPDDVAGVELVYTSLLVQAQTALTDAARHAPPGTRSRSQSYRSAFLLAYASRIGERLEEVNRAVFEAAEAEHGGAFLPVLHDRARAVDDYVDDAFGTLTAAPVRGGYDAAGWASGRRAADEARLTAGDLANAT